MITQQSQAKLEQLSEKHARKILSHNGSIMIVENYFKKGGIGAAHAHDNHEQIAYVVKGSFEVTVGDETKILKEGDSFYAGKNVMHGVVALEDALLLDVFSPIREDFLK